jgi:hypothetical protein
MRRRPNGRPPTMPGGRPPQLPFQAVGFEPVLVGRRAVAETLSGLYRLDLGRHPLERRSDLQCVHQRIVEGLRKAGLPEGEKKTD